MSINKIDQETIEEIIRLRQEGKLSNVEIGKRLGIHKSTVYKYFVKHARDNESCYSAKYPGASGRRVWENLEARYSGVPDCMV